MAHPATVWELFLVGPQGPEGPMQPISPFLPAQFLFLVLRYCDESSFSSHTLAVYASVGLGLQPQLPPASPHPHPFRGLGPELQEQAEERLPGALLCLPCCLHSWKLCGWVKTWCHPMPAHPGYCFSALPSTWSSPRPGHLWPVLFTLQRNWRGEWSPASSPAGQ